LLSKDGESVSLCQNANNVQNETGDRRNECMKSLHTLTLRPSVKGILTGSDNSTKDGKMSIVDGKQGVSLCQIQLMKKTQAKDDADITIY
jgi:hypothetical protein